MSIHSIIKSFVIILVVSALCSSLFADTISYPQSKVEIVTDTLHGVVIDDPYKWLEDQNSPETRTWIDSQNKFTHSLIDPLTGGESLRKRYSELQRVDAIGSPRVRGDNYFFLKRKADEDLYSIYQRKGLHGEDLRLVDPLQLSADKTVSVGIFAISTDGSIMAYRVRKGGEDEVEIRFMDIASKSDLPDKLEKGRYYSVVFTPDKKGFYYALHTKDGTRIFYRLFGADSKDDKYIFGEGYGFDKGVSIGLSSDHRYLLFTVWYGSAAQKTDVFYKKIELGFPILTLVDDIEATFSCDIADGFFYILTDLDAPRRRILATKVKDPEFSNWREIIPQQEATIDEFYLINGKIVLQLIEKASSRIMMYNHDGSGSHNIELPAIGSLGAIRGNWQDDNLLYSFSSFNMPSTIFHYNFEKDKSEIWESPEIPINSDDYIVEQVWYKSYDGTDVPMFLFHRTDLKKDGNNPTLLYGYGGFNSSQMPYFSTYFITLADHDVIFVLTNLRGGGEFGEAWHRAAMLEKKQNTYDDLYAAAEWLIENNYTNSSKLAAMGGSNGGLLVGAALTQRPELFDVIICTYPLLDMINYHKWLVGAFWVPEYGSSDDAEQFKYIHAYSPYHNVQKGTDYPAVMFITGDSDTRVDPAHARKMTALMQAATSSNNPIILDYDTKAGHSGGKPIDQRIEDYVRELKFLFWQWDELK